MEDRREIKNIIVEVDNARMCRLLEIEFESYALNNGSGGNLTRYLKLKKEYELLTTVTRILEKVMNKDYEY